VILQFYARYHAIAHIFFLGEHKMKILSALKSCRMFVPLGIVLSAIVAIASLWSTNTVAMPSYARQTGMDCNSCHIGFNNVPLFTRTGRLFILRGFHQPNSVAGKLREDGFDAAGNDTPQYGGNYLAGSLDGNRLSRQQCAKSRKHQLDCGTSARRSHESKLLCV
jgi:hypothetical protein